MWSFVTLFALMLVTVAMNSLGVVSTVSRGLCPWTEVTQVSQVLQEETIGWCLKTS